MHVVARIHEGQPFDYLHSLSEDRKSHMVCTSVHGAMRFGSYQEAADAAGDAMDHSGHEYRAVEAPAE